MRIIETGSNELLCPDDLSHVHEHLLQGGVCLLPTETGYLLGVDGRNPVAISRIFALKGRAPEHPIHLAVGDVATALRLADLCPRSQLTIERLGPGPLSVIGPACEGVPAELQAGTGTIGVRIPDHRSTLQILRETAIPLTATSANLSGAPAETTLERIQSQFGTDVTRSWMAVRDDRRVYEKPSTLIRWEGETLRILREGPISEAEIRDVIEEGRPG